MDLSLREARSRFETVKRIYERATLKFHGVDGFDVYNPSIPFVWKGQLYIYGRVEKPNDWARSWTGLFRNSGKDDWTLVTDSIHCHHQQLEDPYVAIIDDVFVLGGSHIQYEGGIVKTFFGYFYRGKELDDLRYFTTGPDCMKDIRLVEMLDGRIGVFSRPRGPEILAEFGCESLVGFAIVDTLDELTADIIQSARCIPELFGPGEWGGCNQVYQLEDGLLGVIGHQCYYSEADGEPLSVYTNIAFVFNPTTHKIHDHKIIGTRPCYPDGPSKLPRLTDCAFTSGIVKRPDGLCDLYSGIGDCQAGRIVIDDPFKGHEYCGSLSGR